MMKLIFHQYIVLYFHRHYIVLHTIKTYQLIISQNSAHLLPCKQHLDIRINQVLIISNESFFDICHNAGVHFGQALGSVDFHVESCPLTLSWDVFRQQKITGTRTQRCVFLHIESPLNNQYSAGWNYLSDLSIQNVLCQENNILIEHFN